MTGNRNIHSRLWSISGTSVLLRVIHLHWYDPASGSTTASRIRILPAIPSPELEARSRPLAVKLNTKQHFAHGAVPYHWMSVMDSLRAYAEVARPNQNSNEIRLFCLSRQPLRGGREP